MRLGVFADVHGNLIALDAVLEDGRRRGVDQWWALGDLVAIGPEPVATLDRLRHTPALAAIRGNTERYALTRDRPPPTVDDVRADPSLADLYAAVHGSFTWTHGALGSDGRAWLDELPSELRLVLPDGTRLLGVHASPVSDDGPGISPHRPADALAADLEGAGADLVIGGHTHQPTDRVIGAVRVVNPGSVSNPITDDLRAGYVIVDADATGHRIEHRRVAYDRDAFLETVVASRHPEADYIASFQRGEQLHHPSQRDGAPVPSD